MSSRAAACLHLHLTHCSQTFDSVQQNIAGTAASTATIGAVVAAAFIAATGSICYDLVPFSLPLLLRRSQQGSVELESSDQGGLGDAAA